MKKYFGIGIAIIGLIIVLYPVFTKILNATMQTRAIVNTKAIKQAEDETKKEEEKKKQEEYNEKLKNENKFLADNFFERLEDDSVSSFNGIELGQIIATINIPKLDRLLPIYDGVTTEILQFGIGHLDNTSYPTGGEGTHCIITGHNGLTTTKLFDDLDTLEIGDRFYIDNYNEILAYEIDDIQTLLPTESDSIDFDQDGDFVTLVTCVPKYVNSHRLLVRGKRVENDTIDQVVDYDLNENKLYIKNLIKLILLIVTFILFIVAIFILCYIVDKKSRGKKVKRYFKVKDKQNK